MQEKFMTNNFMIGKCIFLALALVYLIISSNKNVMADGYLFFSCAVFLALMITYEVLQTRHISILICATCLVCFMIWKIDPNCILFLPFLILDLVSYFHWNPLFYLFTYISLYQCKLPFALFFCVITFLIFFYYENFFILNRLRKIISDNEQTELKLKDNIEYKEYKYRSELSRQNLIYENRYLEDKTHLSQELHDKLGHNINGSTYQLEACKILMESDPDRCKEIIQNVINSLRNGMDEIRKVLRNERPDKKKRAIVQLNVLCQDCIDKYGIDTQLCIDENSSHIPEYIWEIILDNTYEAISNSLKYAKCSKIKIEIAVMNKLVRCCITDNGTGCSELKDGMGIQGIRKRIRSIHGILDIDTTNGFKINMLMPLPAEQRPLANTNQNETMK